MVNNNSQPSGHPPVSTSPKDFLPVLFTHVYVAGIPEEEPVGLGIKAVIGNPEFFVHKIKILVISGYFPNTRERGGCHKQRVTPTPAGMGTFGIIVKARRRRILDERGQYPSRLANHPGIFELLVQHGIGLYDAQVIGEIGTRTDLPAIFIGYGVQEIPVLLITR